MNQHTPEQLKHWRRYEDVRQSGRFNMFTPQARRLTGLTKKEYLYCMKHYSTLRTHAHAQASA